VMIPDMSVIKKKLTLALRMIKRATCWQESAGFSYRNTPKFQKSVHICLPDSTRRTLNRFSRGTHPTGDFPHFHQTLSSITKWRLHATKRCEERYTPSPSQARAVCNFHYYALYN
jgi:hypothetical protein